MSKVVLVLSFDEPEDDQRMREIIAKVFDSLGPVLNDEGSRHVWMGIKQSADAVLNVIGAHNGKTEV